MNPTPEPGLAWVAGKITPLAKARVPLLDRGHLLGDGVFETLRVRNGEIMFGDLHLKRLGRGLALLGSPARARTQAWRAVRELARASKHRWREANVRVQVTTGMQEGLAGLGPSFAVTGMARSHASKRADDLHLAIAASTKDRRDPFASVKRVSFLPHIHARREAEREGYNDAIFLNDAGRVCEATTSNVFAVVHGRLLTPGPSEGAVDGVTRTVLLRTARASGFRIDDRLTLSQLGRASEVFLTNTLRGVQTVARVQGLRRRFSGHQGLVAERFRRVLTDATARKAP